MSINNSKANRITIIVLSMALLATWGYILWDKNKVKELKIETEKVIANTTIERDQLQKDLEEAATRYDILKMISTKKDSTIITRNIEINEKKTKIITLLSKVNASQSELKEAKRLIAEMNNDLESFKKQIELLEGQKIQLTREKDAIIEDRNRITQNYDSAKRVIMEKEDIIDVASTLQTSNFIIKAITEKSGGREKSTSKAKRADKLRISFDLNKNKITASGAKQLFIVITAPSGEPIFDEKMGSGTITNRDGQIKKYTQRLDVNYIQNKKQTVSFDWNKSTAFVIGNYRIEVYNNGFKVGDASAPLR